MRKRWWRDRWWRIKVFELAFLIKKSDLIIFILIFLPLFLNISARNTSPFLLGVASNLGKGQTSERSFLSILYLFRILSNYKCPPGCLLNCNLPLIVLFVFAAHASRRCQDLSSVLRSPVHVLLSHCLSTWERGWRRWTQSRFLLAGNHVSCRASHGASLVGRNYGNLPPSYSILWKDHLFSDKSVLNFL